jgi:hypothetical protein
VVYAPQEFDAGKVIVKAMKSSTSSFADNVQVEVTEENVLEAVKDIISRS